VKGLSGGEKKRTAVAVELITAPNLIFLDEPLSGLDSYAAWTVVQVLKDLVSCGCAVLCTIHQPSSEIFQLFDKMICLAEGRTCYCDAVGGLSAYMRDAGLPVPHETNPADHILFHVQTQTLEDLSSFMECWAGHERQRVLPDIALARSSASAIPPENFVRKSCFLQLGYLIQREVREIVRNKIGLFMRFAVTGVMGALFASIFQNIGHPTDDPSKIEEKLQGHFGAVCNVLIGTMFGAIQPLLLQFPLERPIFLREYAANMYGIFSYFMAKTVVELPMALLTSCESWLIAYWIMGFQGSLLYLILISWVLTLAAASTALFISCSVSTAQAAQELAPLALVPQIIFTGVFIPIDLVPKWLQWMEYLCALKYAINLGAIVEFHDSDAKQILFEREDIQEDKAWIYLLILIGIFVSFRTFAMINLRRRAKYVL
jgi:energy-coupling factor transporter ATP-binding protein EcfA2